MPKTANPQLGTDILEAAARLLKQGSADAVTMRAVAEETGVAVTTIYERFGDRRGLLRALAEHFAQEEGRVLSKWTTIEQIFQQYPQFALAEPHRYKLLADTFLERVATSGSPGFELVKKALAQRLGGTSDDQNDLALALVALLAGTVTGIVTAGENAEYQAWIRRAVKSLLDRVLANSQKTPKRLARPKRHRGAAAK